MSNEVYGISGRNKCRKEVLPKANTMEALWSEIKVTKTASSSSRYPSGITADSYVKSIMYKGHNETTWRYYSPATLVDEHLFIGVQLIGVGVAIETKIYGETSMDSTTIDVRIILEKL